MRIRAQVKNIQRSLSKLFFGFDGRTELDVIKNRISTLESRALALEEYVTAITTDRITPLEAEVKNIRENVNYIKTENEFDELYYSDFEDLFRGSKELISDRLSEYDKLFSYISDRKDPLIADIGCGRGELIEYLNDNYRVKAIGVDTSQRFCEAIENRGYLCRNTDALSYLMAEKDNSHDMITMIHVIEHVKNRYLVDLVRQSLRVLKPGGMLIMETPNPENLSVSGETFYLDPTHSTPRHPQTMHFLAKRCGFEQVEIKRLYRGRAAKKTPLGGANGAVVEFLREKFFNAPDYAIIAQSPKE